MEKLPKNHCGISVYVGVNSLGLVGIACLAIINCIIIIIIE